MSKAGKLRVPDIWDTSSKPSDEFTSMSRT